MQQIHFKDLELEVNTIILLSSRTGRTSLAEITFYVPRHPWGCTGRVWKPHTWWISVPLFQWTPCFNILIIYFWRKMTSLPRLINTTLEWRGSNCFGHHTSCTFKTKQTKAGSSLRPVLWPLLGVKQLGRSCSYKVTDSHLFSCHSIGSTPRFFLDLYLF